MNSESSVLSSEIMGDKATDVTDTTEKPCAERVVPAEEARAKDPRLKCACHRSAERCASGHILRDTDAEDMCSCGKCWDDLCVNICSSNIHSLYIRVGRKRKRCGHPDYLCQKCGGNRGYEYVDGGWHCDKCKHCLDFAQNVPECECHR